LGSDEAVVRVTPIIHASDEDIIAYIQKTTDELLSLLGVDGSAVIQPAPLVEGEEPNESISLNIEGDDLGILIGRRGQTLSCLQYIVRLIVGHQKRSWLPVIIDVEGYKQRRYQALQVFARQMAEQVNAKKMSFTLEPMPAYERRIIHLALAEHQDVMTESIGQGESRRVVILPKEK